ncbi:hypothetical protein JCGZ_14317 [Jatropha curcas]|uniref:Cytochrome b5 heme-binding domain-containing protein n=1 Tax=Jatropha curcas TaxID=180498 RepID=A0A067JX51_JATCU|nr:hypothetical protein JCGZ_14317 [Jatropha curcas]
MEEERRYITSEQLKQHNKSGDLWISIQGKVYDVSDWVKEHPGGDTPLLNLGGQDVTDAFIAYHPGTAWKYLDKLFTGYYLEDFKVSDVSKDYRKLYSDFAKLGLFDKKGHIALYSMTSVAVLFCIAVYGVLCCQSIWAHMGSAVLLGILWIQSAYVGHDSGHYQDLQVGMIGLRNRQVGHWIFHVHLGWTGHMVACSFSLSIICFLDCRGAN